MKIGKIYIVAGIIAFLIGISYPIDVEAAGVFCVHDNNIKCSVVNGMTHCTATWCSKCGYGKEGHECGGSCEWSDWQVYGGTQHAKFCTKGCGLLEGVHDSSWGVWNNHETVCTVCGLKGSHTAKWDSEYTTVNGKHGRRCINKTVEKVGNEIVNDASSYECTVISNEHTPNFDEYHKISGGEENGISMHQRSCESCTITEQHVPNWGEWSDNHSRNCSECSLTQTLKHEKVYEIIDTTQHFVKCKSCSFGNTIEVKENHDDTDKNGICDLCKGKLYTIHYETEDGESMDFPYLTNKNVIVTVSLVDIESEKVFVKSRRYTKNEMKSVFEFDSLQKPITVDVDFINKSVTGKVQYSRTAPGSDPVTVTLLPDYEEDTYGDDYTKSIMARIWKDGVLVGDGAWKDAGGSEPITYTFSENGRIEIELCDSIGNGNQNGEATKIKVKIPVVVDWIVSGEATVATTSDVLENGTIFTDILINADRKWTLAQAQDQIAVSLYVIKNGWILNVTEDKANLMINKIEVRDFNENRITEPEIGRGLYYIKVGIGGSGVFINEDSNESTKYIVALDTVKPADEAGAQFTISGKNRIEVTVNKLKDLT